MIRIARERLTAWAIACLEKVGVPHDEAKLVAESLVQTSVWGIDSHGVLRLTHYLNRITKGSIKSAAVPVVTRTGPVTAQVHGEDGLGIVHATLAMEEAIDMARESGAGIVGVGHSSHCGAIGLYTRMAAREGLIGIAMTHSNSVVVPHGRRRKHFGTNPFPLALPRAAQVDAVIADLRTQGEILFPGEPELIAEKERVASGVPIDDEAMKDMNAWSKKLGVAPLTQAP